MARYRPKLPPLDPCPVEHAVAIVGGKWKARMIFEIARAPTSTGELIRALPRAKPQVVAAQLRALARDGVIRRLPPIAGERWGRFALTDEGARLCAALDGVAAWGREAIGGWTPPAPPEARSGHRGDPLADAPQRAAAKVVAEGDRDLVTVR